MHAAPAYRGFISSPTPLAAGLSYVPWSNAIARRYAPRAKGLLPFRIAADVLTTINDTSVSLNWSRRWCSNPDPANWVIDTRVVATASGDQPGHLRLEFRFCCRLVVPGNLPAPDLHIDQLTVRLQLSPSTARPLPTLLRTPGWRSGRRSPSAGKCRIRSPAQLAAKSRKQACCGPTLTCSFCGCHMPAGDHQRLQNRRVLAVRRLRDFRGPAHGPARRRDSARSTVMTYPVVLSQDSLPVSQSVPSLAPTRQGNQASSPPSSPLPDGRRARQPPGDAGSSTAALAGKRRQVARHSSRSCSACG